MASTWDDVQRMKRVEARADELGFKFTSGSSGRSWVDIGGGATEICLRPKDDCLPHYSRDARLFSGTVEQIDDWLRGIAWARDYDEMLKLTNSGKRQAKEQVERNKHLLKTIKTGKLVSGHLSGQFDADDMEITIDDGVDYAAYADMIMTPIDIKI